MKTNYVLIDYENVQPENFKLLDQEWIRVFVFVGQGQSKLPIEMVNVIQKVGSRAEYVQLTGTGHNALDFHIAFYIGQLSASEHDAFFHIISNDKGFDPLIGHLKSRNISVDRFSKIDDIPALIQGNIAVKPLNEKVAFAKERLLKVNEARPRSHKKLANHLSAMFGKILLPEKIEEIIAALKKQRVVRENGKRIEYSDESK